MDTFRKWLNKPKADDKSLLARFYHADRALTAVASELDSFDGRAEPDRCSRLVSRLRQGQDKVLSITNRIMEELLGDDRAPRAFRAKFPEEVLQENLAGQLWFGAECLAAGSSIMNREFESTSMRPLAQAVTKSLDNVRNLLRDQCLRNNIPNSPTLKLDINDSTTEQLYESLKIFDRLFAEFELRYVSAMVQVKSKQEYEMQELICVLFSETLQRALQIHLLEQDQVDSFDPALMFSIPRLAIVTGLIIFNKGPLNMDMPADQLSEMFRPFRTILIKIRDLLKTLNKNELYQLEKLLCTNEEIHLKQINGSNNNNNNNNNNNSSLNNSQSDQQNSQSLACTENTIENQNKIAIKDEIPIIERRNSKLSEKLKQQKEKDRQRENEIENDKKINSDVVNGENPKLNDCDQDLVSTNSNNVLGNSQQIINKTSTSTTISRQIKYNEIISRTNHKSGKSNSRHVSASKFSKLQLNQENNNDNCNIISTSPTNSISSASSSATTADISSDWTDDDDDDDGDDNNEEKLKELSNNTNSDLVTADCATGFLIPNTNFGNLLQQNDDPLTDNIVASEDEYASAGDNEILTNGNSLNNVTIGTLTTTLPSDIVTNSTDNIRNNNNSFIEDSSFKSENDGTKKKLKSSKTPLKISNKIKYSLSTTPLTEQPSCSRMDITDSSDESEISRTITKQAQQQQSSIASTTTTTANSNLDTKSSCDSISKSSKSSTTSGCDDGAVSNISARKHEVKNGKHHRHHHHHHHHNRNCHHHHRHVSNTNTLIASSNSSSMTTTSSTDRSSTSTNSSENHKHHEYRHHSRKHKSKHQQSSTNNTHNNSVDCASSGDTTSSLSDGDPHEVDLALKAAGRMKFKSTENLLHRLFVCIAGVADQLQTNFASDLRQILRSVFFMNTTPVQEEIKIPEKSKDSTDLFEFRPSESDVIQENNAGSNQSIYSAAEEANPESDNVFMNDGSPNQSIDSGSNTSSNQEQQLQQHNRNNRHSERGNSLDSANSIVQHQTSRQQQQLNEYNNKNNPRNNIERTRSLGEECEENEQNTRKLHLLQERRRLSSQGSNSAGSESPVNSSASNSPVGERSIRTTNCFPNNDDTAIISTSAATIIGATAYSQPQPQPQQQQQITSNPINVVRRSTDRRSSTSQVLSHSTTNRRNANNNNNISTTSASLPKPSPPAWIPDEDAPRCMACTIPFTAFRRRHHCRNCGGVFCGGCSNSSAPLPKYGLTKAVRVCRDCYVREVGT